jgi:uncharacterized protein
MALRYFWILLGWIFFGIGITGLFLPLLPCTPFMILATFCFSKGSEKLHQWILGLPRVGPMVRDWEDKGVIRLRAKLLSTLVICASASYPLFVMAIAAPLRALVALVISGVLVFIWSRPSS